MHSTSYLIGICGGSGSGKTTFVKALKKKCSQENVCFISQDEYYLPRDEQKTDIQGIKNFDLPSAVDSKQLYDDIHTLLNGEAVIKQKYNFNNPLATPSEITYQPSKIIIVEGLFILHESYLRELFNLKVFINTTDPLKIIRRIKRDLEERNYPLDDVLYRYEKHVLPSYQQFLAPYINTCDLVVNNDLSFDQALEVLVGFLKCKLQDS